MIVGEIQRLHQAFRDGSLSPVAVAEEHLARAEAENVRLNAFTRLLPERAMGEAKASAARYRRGMERSILDGVPISVKDLMHVAGVATTSGSNASAAEPEPEDAEVVARLSAAGAVVFGKNNLLEYAYGVVHPGYGPARNPWDVSRSTGGSSSGSGAAVAAGIGFASIGTDTAGSVRNPAAWCGTVGLMPTLNALPTAGVVPLSPTLDHVGVLARTVADTRAVFRTLRGDGAAATDTEAPDRPLRVGVVHLEGAQEVVQERCDAALSRLEADGAELVDIDPLPWTVANAATLVLLYAEACEIHAERLGSHWQGYSPAIRSRLLAGAAITGVDYLRARAIRHALRQAWGPTLRAAGVDVVALPTLPLGAPAERSLAPRTADLTAATRFTSAFALLGVPAISIPVGLDHDGMPIGLQIASVADADDRVLAVAARVEMLVGTFSVPSGAPSAHEGRGRQP